MIQVPPSEKIMEAATGDKDFWIVDIVGSFCFVHPAREGISTNLNLITDKGNIYSFTLSDVTESGLQPDLKVIVVPVDASNIVASQGSPQYVPAAQLQQVQGQLANLQQHVESTVDEYKSSYQTQLRFDYKSSKPTRARSTSSRSTTTTNSPTSRPPRRRSSPCTRCVTASPTSSTTTSATVPTSSRR